MLSTPLTVLLAGLSWRCIAQRVLMVDTLEGYEYDTAHDLGYNVTVVTSTQFSQMTTPEFATYNALIIADPYGYYPDDATIIGFLNATKQVWSPAITGNIILIGTDPSFHEGVGIQGAANLIDAAIPFVVNGSSTGLYLSLSSYYETVNPPVHFDALSEFGDFTVQGAQGGYNYSHIVASSSALTGLNDTDISGWTWSVHEAFTSYPSDFSVLAIALNATGQGQQNFADGSFGIPYILARGVTPNGCGNGNYQPEYGEECDDGSLNGTPGDLCSDACRCVYGVMDATNGTCNSSPPVTTVTSTSTTSFLSLQTDSSTYTLTTANVVQTTSLTSIEVDVSTFTSGSSTGPTTLTSTTVLPSVFTSPSVIKTASIFTVSTEVTEAIPVIATSTISLSISNVAGMSVSAPLSILSRRPRPSNSTKSVATTSLKTFVAPSTAASPPDLPPPPGAAFVTTADASFSQISTTTREAGLPGASAGPTTPVVVVQRPFPPGIGDFRFMGCYGSKENYPGYSMVHSDSLMTLEMCIGACSNYSYAGAHNTDCYCSDVDDPMTILPELDCHIPCPGNWSQHCGGYYEVSRRLRRQTVPNGVLLSIYAVTDAVAPEITAIISSAVIPSVTTELGAGAIIIPAGNTLTTKTFLPTSASTITSCAPTAIDCVVGLVTTIIVPETSIGLVPTSTTSSTTSSSMASCVRGYCANGYTLEPHSGDLDDGEPAFIQEPCTCSGGYHYVLAPCGTSACDRMALYALVPCSSSTRAGVIVYRPQACDECFGGIEFVQSKSYDSKSGESEFAPGDVTGDITASAADLPKSTESLESPGAPAGNSNRPSGSPPITAAAPRSLSAYLSWVTLISGFLVALT